jgi:hypothetical protein
LIMPDAMYSYRVESHSGWFRFHDETETPS